MANRNFPQARLFSMHLKPVLLDMRVSIGSSGAPTIVSGTGKGIASITRLTTGTYRIQLQDNYVSLLELSMSMQAPVTGSAVNGGSFVTSTVYQIVTLGTTTQAQWVTAGVPAGITAAPGVIFKAAGAGAGTGTVKAIGTTGLSGSYEIVGNTDVMLSNQPFTGPGQSNGGYMVFQTLGPTAAGNTAPVATDPASGSSLYITIRLSDSSIQ